MSERLKESMEILSALKFGPKQRSEMAGHVLLAILGLTPKSPWKNAKNPLVGILSIMSFIKDSYDVPYAPNTRETIRDDAVSVFVEEGLLIKNPDKPERPTNSGKTVYQIAPEALEVIRTFGTKDWESSLSQYLDGLGGRRAEINRKRELSKVKVTLPGGKEIALSPGGQNPLVKSIIELFCPTYSPGGTVMYIGDTAGKFTYFEKDELKKLGVDLAPSSKIPDVIVLYQKKNWLLLIEAVSSAGPIDGKRRRELKELFAGCSAGLVFVTAFPDRRTMQSFLANISWESEVWIAEDPDHMIHFDGDRFLGPYPDVMPKE